MALPLSCAFPAELRDGNVLEEQIWAASNQ